MPSKAAVVAEQSATVTSGSGRNSVTDSTTESSSVSQQIVAILHHKCRNLEKRKKKLDDYRKVGVANLKTDQREALTHFGEVVQLIDLVNDLRKQFESTFSEHEVLLKRQAKAERNIQRKRDLVRMRDSLDIKFVLNNITDENARASLLESEKVSESELVLLDRFYETVEPTLTACGNGKAENFLFKATDSFERVLRKEEKPFSENYTYAEMSSLFQRIYQSLIEQPKETVESVEVTENSVTEVQEPNVVEEAKNDHDEVSNEKEVVASPQKQPQQNTDSSNIEAPKQQNNQQANLDEIVKPGSFSFLQESQISFNNRSGATTHDFVNSNSDQQMGQWVPEQSPGKRGNENEPVWNNRQSANHENTEQHHHSQQQHGNRNRNERNGRQQHNRNRKPHYNQSGGADENNESGSANWPQNDADYSQWKPDDVNSGNQRDGGWIGQEPRRRNMNGGNRGGRGGFRGGQNSNQQFGDNRRHFNRGPRSGAPSHQNRSAPVGGSGYAE